MVSGNIHFHKKNLEVIFKLENYFEISEMPSKYHEILIFNAKNILYKCIFVIPFFKPIFKILAIIHFKNQ